MPWGGFDRVFVNLTVPLVPGGGSEEAEALERRQGVHGLGGRAAPSGHCL